MLLITVCSGNGGNGGGTGGSGGSGGTGGSASAGGSGGGTGSAGGGSGGGSGGGAVGPLDVTGHRQLFYRLQDRDLVVPDDVAFADAGAWLLTDAGFVARPLTATGDGGFRVANIPVGATWQLGFFDLYASVPVFVVTRARSLDLDQHNLAGDPAAPRVSPSDDLSVELSFSDYPFDGVGYQQLVAPESGTLGLVQAPDAKSDGGTLFGPGHLSIQAGGLPSGGAGRKSWLLSSIESVQP